MTQRDRDIADFYGEDAASLCECYSDPIVTNILTVYDSASSDALRDGATWYPAMARIMREHAATSSVTAMQAAGCYAATSINTKWSRNLELAAKALADFAVGKLWKEWYCDPSHPSKLIADVYYPLCKRVIKGKSCLGHGTGFGTLGTSVKTVRRILSGENMTSVFSGSTAQKLINFTANLSGDYNAVTVDRWAHRIATNGAKSNVPTGKTYQHIAEAYRTAASLRGVNPATMQAVTWCVARGTAN